MAGIYKIGSKLGYDLASGMKAGDSITATDGSIWTMGNDGKIQVNQNGNMLQGVVTYQPTNQQAIAAMKGGAGYSSPYNATLQQAIAGIGSSQWGGWDKDTDESYKAYRKEYLREADRTMQDVLGQYAQNTGGIAGSSAIAAASQAADYQKAQLADKIPELYDVAYGRYMQDVQRTATPQPLSFNDNLKTRIRTAVITTTALSSLPYRNSLSSYRRTRTILSFSREW